MRQSIGVAARRRLLSWCGLLVVLGTLPVVTFAGAADAADPCGPGSNRIVCENSKPGNPYSEWDITGSGDESIQGFATDMSVDAGETIGFKVDTDATEYEILIYRTGWYGGDGARLVATVDPSAAMPQDQPACLYDEPTGLVDCGNWGLSATWAVPDDAVSGVYIARLERADTGGASHIVFVVRNDTSSSPIVFQTSDTTWQAYNEYGGNSLYSGEPWGRAVKVSYNRPFTVREDTPSGRDSFFGSEYAMIRWLERNGYDVSYISGVDTDRYGAALLDGHDVFLSVGHDEYWSGDQRDNVEAARDAGMHLAFLSGNEVYWKTRWEPSIDGSGTPHRTMVTYKETRENAKVDPSPEWTGTWRDPRFSPPADGGRPENSLTGTLFTVNCCTYAIKVPAEFGDLRFWRNTSVAALQPGEEEVLPWGTLGYEWDEDVDNGHRPAGAFRMSSTTEVVPQKLIDYGTKIAELPATHHLMMYRAPSGALVFGAGTVQWSWGLDDYHDGTAADTSPAIQQATVNVLADMGVQPGSLQSDLTAATQSTDASGPMVEISSPVGGASIGHGETITISGTATDVGGGVVAGVEVSVDGGATWSRAEGRGQWTFQDGINMQGSRPVMARAVDDSGNIGPSASVTVAVDCPCRIFDSGDVPEVEAAAGTTALEVGVRFEADVDGWIEGLRFYKGPGNTGTHVGSLWDGSGNLLARATFADETATGWQQVSFGTPVPITAGTAYVASYHAPNGRYPADNEWFAYGPTLSPPLRAVQDTDDEPNGVYVVSSVPRFPTNTYDSTNYWVDVVFHDVEPPDVRAPLVSAVSPLGGATSVPVGSAISVTFDEPIDPASVEMSVTSAAGETAGEVSVASATGKVTFTPQAALGSSTRYTVEVDAADLAGNAMAEPAQFSFTTAVPDGVVAALWDDSAVPAVAATTDTRAVNLGVRFIASEDLEITGVRFYKGPGNTGTHVGSLWSAAGELMAQATFAGESTNGWQQVLFDQPVTVTPGSTYVASYHAPVGAYAANAGYFTTDHNKGPLTAPALSGGTGNGVYRYGSSPAFPTTSFGATNYWVTPVYAVPPDLTAPTLAVTAPLDGTSRIRLDSVIRATFDEPVDPASVEVAVTGSDGPVAGTASFDQASSTLTFTPDADLDPDTGYSVAISAVDLAGNASSEPLTFAFTTSDGAEVVTFWGESTVPPTPAVTEARAIEVGVKFSASVDGFVTGVRFYKGSGNTGTHVGSLWTASGELLERATFTYESTTGWQEVVFVDPVPVTAGVTYIASYHAPKGHYAAASTYFAQALVSGDLTAPSSASSGGNGVYRYAASPLFPNSSYGSTNYWVTPVFEEPPDTTQPGLASSSPADGATGVDLDAAVTAAFDEPVDGDSAAITVSSAAGPVAGSTTFDAASSTATFVPATALAASTAYTVTVSAVDLAGNHTAADLGFDFTTTSAAVMAALWDQSVIPAVPVAADTAAVNVGVAFTSSQSVLVTGIRFYKGSGNTGTHVGSLWSGSGQLLAQATFTGESATGWQEVSFATPVQINAGTTYVASYYAPKGRYSVTSNYFTSAYTSGPLTALKSVPGAVNGRYSYGTTPALPTTAYRASNYWVSPVYQVD